MSMLSSQADELRLMARLVRDYDYKEISRMLREAADTIESLRDRLQDIELGRGTCEYVIEDNMNETEGMGDVWFRCTNCGTSYDYYADEWLLKMPYCPRCGCEVER